MLVLEEGIMSTAETEPGETEECLALAELSPEVLGAV